MRRRRSWEAQSVSSVNQKQSQEPQCFLHDLLHQSHSEEQAFQGCLDMRTEGTLINKTKGYPFSRAWQHVPIILDDQEDEAGG